MEKVEKEKNEKLKTNDINSESNRDTIGDTKVFQIIRKEDIVREERRKKAIEKENQGNGEKTGDVKDTENKAKANNVQKTENKVSVNSKKETESEPVEKQNVNRKKYNNYESNNKQKLNNYEANVKEENSNKKILIFLLILINVILVLVIFSTIFGIINLNSSKIIKGVKINQIDVSGLTVEEAKAKIENQLNNGDNNFVTVKMGDYEKKVSINDIEGKFNVDKSATEAFETGRKDDLIQNNYKTIGTLIANNNIKSEFSYNEELLEKKVNEINIELPGVALDASYIIEGNKLIIKNGSAGLQIKKAEFKNKIIEGLSNNERTIEIPVEHAEVKEINIDEIHNEVYKKPVNAYYTTSPRKIYKEEEGLDFAISVAEAKKIISENKDEYEIPLKKLEPQIKVSDLDDGAFPDKLSTFTTNYGTADVNRNANIALAARSINSRVVMPGETFSYNQLIGECSTKTGYKESTIYLNGKLSTGIGGGICQVSTTLYNTVLRANLEIVERRNHSLGVTYVPAGQDAMVSIGTSDFKFKNNRDYPIKVVAYVGPGSITCEIKGVKNETEYEVKLESKVIEKDENKYKVETYKLLYLNGKLVSRTWLSKDTYKYHQ